MELGSRPLASLCGRLQATLLQVCLTSDDLRALGVWDEAPHASGISPAIVARMRLRRGLQTQPRVAQRVTDLLDLRFLNSLAMLRSLDEDELAGVVAYWLANPEGEALPGLLWSLCTDSRAGALRLGVRLCEEAQELAWENLRATSASTTTAASEAR